MSFRHVFAVLFLVMPAWVVSLTPAAASQRHAYPLTITDDTGFKSTILHRPARIISLDPRDTETLFAVGAESRMVADGGKEVEKAACCTVDFRYPSQWPSRWGRDYPVRAPKLTHIEGGYSAAHPFNVELVEKERPDVVFTLQTDQGAIDKMRSLGLTVIVLNPGDFEQIEHDIRLVGDIVGNRHKAGVVLASIKQRFESTRRKLAGVKTRPRVFYEIDDSSGTPYTACAGSFIDQMLSLAKAINVAHNVQPCPKSNPYPQMNTEALIHANPGVILLGDGNYGTTAQQVRSRPAWNTISAVVHNRIYTFDDDLVSRAGVREVIGLEAVARLVHPAAFK